MIVFPFGIDHQPLNLSRDWNPANESSYILFDMQWRNLYGILLYMHGSIVFRQTYIAASCIFSKTCYWHIF